MGVRQSVVLFADIIGCSEISNNCNIVEYDKIISEFHNTCAAACSILFPTNEYSSNEIEITIRGDELCLILHSGLDVATDNYWAVPVNKASIIKDVQQAVRLAFGLKLLWLISNYNKARMKCALLPRDIGIGINIGPVMFSVHPSPVRQNTSEGYSINLAKRIEGISRLGYHSKIFVCRELAHICSTNDVLVAFTEGKIYEIKGITTPPYLHEIKDINDNKIVTKSAIMQELKKITQDDLELYYNAACTYIHEFWLRKLVRYILLASNDKRAFDLLKEANLLQPDELIGNLLEKGHSHFYMHDFTEAISHYHKILEIDSNFSRALYNLALCYHKIGDNDNALTYFNQYMSLTHIEAHPFTEIGFIYAEMGKYDKAIEFFRKAREIDPNNIEPLIEMSLVYADKKDFESALACLDEGKHLNPTNDALYIAYGHISRELGDIKSSLDYLNKAISLNPNNEDAYIELGITQGEIPDLPLALNTLQKAIEINPFNPSANYNIACIFAMNADNEKALSYLNNAIKANKKYKGFAAEDKSFAIINTTDAFKILIS